MSRAYSHNRLSKYLPRKETVLRLTAAAAFLTSAIFGAIELHEGLTHGDRGGYELVSNGKGSNVVGDILNDSAETFTDLSLGVAGIGLSGLILAGGIMQYRRQEGYVDGDDSYGYNDFDDAPADMPALPTYSARESVAYADEDREATFARRDPAYEPAVI